MSIIVQKFGGTSVADLHRISQVANIVKTETNLGNKIVVVVSAMAGVTNSIISDCSSISSLNTEHNLREYDAALSTGEIVTSALLSLELQNIGLKAQSLQAWQIPIKTNDRYKNAIVTAIDPKILLNLLKNNIIPVISGFQGVNQHGNMTTLGKGGSDITAALIAGAVNAKRCDIYTDVKGIYQADPRIVHEANLLPSINIDHLIALSAAGAKVMHTRAAIAAKRYNFQLRILSSFQSDPAPTLEHHQHHSGTIVNNQENNMENQIVKTITSNKNLLKIQVTHPKLNLIQLISKLVNDKTEINETYQIDNMKSIIITDLHNRSFAIKSLELLKNQNLISEYHLDTKISTISIFGYGIRNDSSLLAKVMSAINDDDIEILSIAITDLKISLLIDEDNSEKLVKILYHKLID